LVRRVVGHKLGQFALVLIGAYLLFRLGVPWLSRTLTGQSAPVPAHLLWTIYMPIVLLVIVSANGARGADQCLRYDRSGRPFIARGASRPGLRAGIPIALSPPAG